MNAKTRAAIYAVAACIGTVALIYGWATREETEAWLRLLDSALNLLVIIAPLVALKNLTPDAPKVVPGEVVADAPTIEPAGGEPNGD